MMSRMGPFCMVKCIELNAKVAPKEISEYTLTYLLMRSNEAKLIYFNLNEIYWKSCEEFCFYTEPLLLLFMYQDDERVTDTLHPWLVFQCHHMVEIF